MNDCIFCKIVKKEITADIVYEDKEIIAFHDINPKAALHILLIPKKHIPTLFDLTDPDMLLMQKIICLSIKIAKDFNLERGYRLLTNCNEDGGQVVKHIHFHLLGGQKLDW